MAVILPTRDELNQAIETLRDYCEFYINQRKCDGCQIGTKINCNLIDCPVDWETIKEE